MNLFSAATLRRSLLLAVLFVQGALAQSILEFDIWMQKIDVHSQNILKNVQRRDAKASIHDARELERLYRLMETFYEKRGQADDAVFASWFGREKAADAARAVESGDFDRAYAAATEIAQDCRNCHDRFKPI